MKKIRLGLLARIVIAILLGVVIGQFAPLVLVEAFATFNGLFSQFLNFCIPLIIVGLVAFAIADIGRGAAKMLLITVAMAYAATLFSGFFSCGVSAFLFPRVIHPTSSVQELVQVQGPEPWFTVSMPPVMDVMTALLLSFVLGLGVSSLRSQALKQVLRDFQEVMTRTIARTIIPLLPPYIFGIFLIMTHTGQVYSILLLFVSVIGIIFAMHIVLLLLQFGAAGLFVRRNPLKLLATMLPAYFTALGTQSSAATIPVTLAQTKKNGVHPDVAGFVIPLCATIHLSGSIMKIVACVMAVMVMLGMPLHFGQLAGFICLLGIAMIAAPGVPGGAIMATIGLISMTFGFNDVVQALIIGLYIAMDSFGTACNVTGDGALALAIDKIMADKGDIREDVTTEEEREQP